jgi:hypothetical protein
VLQWYADTLLLLWVCLQHSKARSREWLGCRARPLHVQQHSSIMLLPLWTRCW